MEGCSVDEEHDGMGLVMVPESVADVGGVGLC